MAFILPDIFSLRQHIETMRKSPESYRPAKCPCGHSTVWGHGYYTRMPAGKDPNGTCLNPIFIARFYCADCRRTCSVLPECMTPRSMYLWEVRQACLLLLLAGASINQAHASNGSLVTRATIKRWWRTFVGHFPEFSLHLRVHLPCMGRHAGFTEFWLACLALRPLSSLMRLLHEAGVRVP